MSNNTLPDFVEATATEFGIPGVAVGVWVDGRETYACHGVTSVDNPLPVDKDTLYVLGSVTKTYTATALMRLVAEGRVELDAPVRRYVPELRLKDERAAAEITVLNLLNHTSGLDWGITFDTGEGDDTLAVYRGCINKTFHYLGITPAIPRKYTVQSSIAMMNCPPNGQVQWRRRRSAASHHHGGR